MLSKLTSQHKWILAIVAILLINGAVWMFGLAPALEKVGLAREKLQHSKEEIIGLQKRLEQLNAIDTVTLEEELALYNQEIPEQGQLSEFITELESRADRLNVTLDSIRISEPLPRNPYLATSISFSISGAYPRVIAYLTELEEHERMLLVENFSFSGSSDSIHCPFNLLIFAEDFDAITPYAAPGRADPFGE